MAIMEDTLVWERALSLRNPWIQQMAQYNQDDAGRWTINFGSRTAGILLPAVGMDGLICGMQIRLDTPLRRRDDPPGKSGAKYIWLSSIGKPHGVTSSSPLHFVGEPFAKTVYVTEGLLKADPAPIILSLRCL